VESIRHGVALDDDALKAAVEWSVRYLPDFRLPDKALDLVDQACAAVRFRTLTPQGKMAGGETPPQRPGARRASHFEELRVGREEIAKAVAEFLFHDERRMIRFDMSEFMEEHSVAKLIGSPPGYVGHNEGGQLTDAIRTHPYSVVLFDEIEKAHLRVLDLFLQIFDEGTLTDSQGRKCSFRESVNFRKAFIECLLADGEEAAEATTDDYQREEIYDLLVVFPQTAGGTAVLLFTNLDARKYIKIFRSTRDFVGGDYRAIANS